VRDGAKTVAVGENDAVPLRLRRPQLPMLLASLTIAVCLVAIGVGVNIAVTGDERQALPEPIEKILPVRSAIQVPAQSQVFVDLLPGYEGVLIIDGLELETVSLDELEDAEKPGQQITLPPTTIYEPGNATLTFDPSPESSISEFSQGEHLVQLIYWKTVDGRARARSFSWTFTVF
jgi:hypothetical protein